MSVLVSTQVWHDKGIESKAELLLMLCLADFAHENGECWPSIATIAERTRCDTRSVQRMMDRLKKKGLVEVHMKAGPRGCNLYRVVPRPWDPPGILPPRHHNRVTPALEPSYPGTATTRTVTEPLENRKERENVDSDESTSLLEDSETDSPEATEPTPQAEAAAPPRRSPRMPPPRPQAQESLETRRDGDALLCPTEGIETLPPKPQKQGDRVKAAGLTPKIVMEEWNRMAEANGLPEVVTSGTEKSVVLTKKILTRMRSPYWEANWRAALEQIPKALWRVGEKGFFASIDYFLRPGRVEELVAEMKRTAAAPVTGPAPAPKPKSKFPVGSKEWEKEQMSR